MDSKGAKLDEIKHAIDPTVMSECYGITPNKSRYYFAHDDDHDIVYTVCFGTAALLRTVYGDQPVRVDEIDRIELIDADSLDDGDNLTDDVETPQDAIYDIEDYLRMFEMAAEPERYQLIVEINESDQLGEDEIEDKSALKALSGSGLIRTRSHPERGSYHELTEVGEVVLKSLREGLTILSEQEQEIQERHN